MKITPAFPVSAMRGTVSNSQLSFSTVQGEVIARAKVIPANPQTAEQTAVRSFITAATKNWASLSPSQREAWDAYARTFLTGMIPPTTAPGLSAYVRSNVNRQVLGLALISAAPVAPPPAPVRTFSADSGTDPDGLGLTVDHTHTTVSGLVLLVRMTPATATLARRPQATDQRYVRGASADSTVALPTSGTSVLFGPTRYAVQDGQRFGVEARIVRTADGIASQPIYGDFIKVV